ncbi:MAG: hypothetical protein KY463_10040 [Actinobacteria bacterium]|nr:hypothetical protein [Actinomycetota bacterium]
MQRRCVAMLGAAALAVSGCGGGDEQPAANDGTAAAAPLTKAQFVARADAVCREIKQAQRPYTDRLRSLEHGTELERVAPILEGALEESRKGLRRLRELRAQAPREDRATFDTYLAAAERLLAQSAKLSEAAKADDRAAGREVAATVDALSADEQRLADEYGLDHCGDVF